METDTMLSRILALRSKIAVSHVAITPHLPPPQLSPFSVQFHGYEVQFARIVPAPIPSCSSRQYDGIISSRACANKAVRLIGSILCCQ